MANNLPANPLAALVSRAAQSLPAETGATARSARRDVRLVLADTSASMAEAAGGRTKIDALHEALAALPGDVRTIAFSWRVVEVPRGAPLPAPNGGTALDLALQTAAGMDPDHVLVVSDGHPDDPASALRAASRLRCRIDVIYCGPDGDREGMAFMRRLARHGGSARHHNLAREPEKLGGALRQLMIEGPR